MNILTDELPDCVEIGDRIVDLNTDFKTCLRIIMAFEDPELTAVEKQTVLLTNLYGDQDLGDLREAITQGVKFLNGGGGDSEKDQGWSPRTYSFSKDANYIFAAFKQTHNIDLEESDLHWWKFIALFMDLGADTTFCQLVGLRKRVKTGKATKEEKTAAREMGSVFEIPELDTRTIEEKEAERRFMNLVISGGKSAE